MPDDLPPRHDSHRHRSERHGTRASGALTPARARRDIQRRFYLASGLSWFATVLPMPVNVLLATSRGFGLDEVGLFMGVYAATVAALEVPTGGLADAIGRKRVALAAIVLQAVATGVLLLAFSFPVALAYAVLLGASRALGSGALAAWFVDALQEVDADVDLQPPLALAGTVDLIALAGGTLIGGALPMAFGGLPADGTAVLTPLATPLVAAMGMQAVAFVATALAIREVRPASPASTGGAGGAAGHLGAIVRGAVGVVRAQPVLGLLLATQATTGFALMAMETFWQPYLEVRLGGAAERTWIFGAVLAGSFVAGMLGNLAAVPAARRLGGRHARLAAAAVGLQGLALVVLASAPSAATAIPVFWAAYFAMGAAASPVAAIFHRAVPSARRSVMLSVRSLAGFTGSFLGTAALGLVAEATSVATAWVVAGAALTIGVVLLARSDRALHAQGTTAPDAQAHQPA